MTAATSTIRFAKRPLFFAMHLLESVTTLAVVAIFLQAPMVFAQTEGEQTPLHGKELYQAACSACHGPDGKGAPQAMVGFEIPLPDFTDCPFASREPDSDWIAITHSGGPARGFSPIMPAFRDALDEKQISSVVDHLHRFCRDQAWPRGDLNLPRPLVTEKAFPEDEAVLTTTIATEGSGAVTNDLLYERRFGARNQIEIKLPLPALEGPQGGWHAGVGDIALGLKRDLFHSMESGSIFSVGGEAVLPTGNRSTGLGKGYTVFEGYAAFGQILPSDAFVHLQAGIEAPKDSSRAAKESFWRAVVGKSWAQGNGLGRAWSPMLEMLGTRELQSGEKSQWDLVPQIQISLSTRQHILFNVGVRLPVNNAGPRQTQVMFYFLWDWFDGGLREGW